MRDASVPINAARSRGNLQLVLASHFHQELAIKAEIKTPEGTWPVPGMALTASNATVNYFH